MIHVSVSEPAKPIRISEPVAQTRCRGDQFVISVYSPTSGALQLPGSGYKLERRLRTVQVHSVCQIPSDKQRRESRVNICSKWSKLRDEKGLKSQAEDAAPRWNCRSPALAHGSLLSFNLWTTERQQETTRSDSLNTQVFRNDDIQWPVHHLRKASPYWNNGTIPTIPMWK